MAAIVLNQFRQKSQVPDDEPFDLKNAVRMMHDENPQGRVFIFEGDLAASQLLVLATSFGPNGFIRTCRSSHTPADFMDSWTVKNGRFIRKEGFLSHNMRKNRTLVLNRFDVLQIDLAEFLGQIFSSEDLADGFRLVLVVPNGWLRKKNLID